jgi:hypothetical protein
MLTILVAIAVSVMLKFAIFELLKVQKYEPSQTSHES